ncbi:MFS transporter [Anaerobacillus arseniciselenatis]|uniref:MFS transporter n=1 Tax=Anaerobacillus arseniciselenatis TaxID=85682 RepID=A0A1S2LKG5_9BACI|nr:MFS transporter [Anaerobacillus arseniciselenatis]OIJ12886.1 MFS transporter [Anaerobacillus arseniciselenatis]
MGLVDKKSDRVIERTPFYYGWVIVFMGALGVFLSGPGQTYSVSIFIDAYIEEFGWSRSLISSLYSGATLLSGFLMILMGKLIDVRGQRSMSIFAGAMLGIACLFNSFILGPLMLFIGFFLIRVFGQGLMEMVPNTLIPRWFVKKRGKAIAFMEVGGFLSSAALPPLNVWLIASLGWSGAWQVWAGVLILFYVPLVFFFIKNSPENYGLQPDGYVLEQPKVQKKKVTEPKVGISEKSWTLNEAIKTLSFWGVLFCIAVPAMVNTGMTFHIVSILGEQGVTRAEASFVLSMMALVAFPLSFLAGVILDRMSLHKVFAITFVVEAAAIVVLLVGDSYTAALIFGLLRGVAAGFGTICLALIIPNFFGTAHLGSLKGVGVTSTVVASALGPLPFGVAYDWFGGYTEILLVMLVFPLLATVVAWMNKGPKLS